MNPNSGKQRSNCRRDFITVRVDPNLLEIFLREKNSPQNPAKKRFAPQDPEVFSGDPLAVTFDWNHRYQSNFLTSPMVIIIQP